MNIIISSLSTIIYKKKAHELAKSLDLLVEMTVGNQIKRTQVIDNAGGTASWIDSFSFQVNNNDMIKLIVKDEDVFKNEIIIETIVNVSDIMNRNNVYVGTVAINSQKYEGGFNFKIELKNSSNPQYPYQTNSSYFNGYNNANTPYLPQNTPPCKHHRHNNQLYHNNHYHSYHNH